MTAADLLVRIRATLDTTGEIDWSLVRPDFEIHDHELLDSSVHRGREGWNNWVRDWQQAWEDYSVERTDAQLWTFSGDRLARMDYYPDYRPHERPWSVPGTGSRSEKR